MRFILLILLLGAGYYSLTYGISLWKDDKNKLGGAGAIGIALTATIASIIQLFTKF